MLHITGTTASAPRPAPSRSEAYTRWIQRVFWVMASVIAIPAQKKGTDATMEASASVRAKLRVIDDSNE